MDKDELQDLYDSGRLDSPQVLMNLRGEIRQHTGLNVPRKRVDVADWWDDHKSVFAREIGQEEQDSEEGDQE